MCFWKIFGHVAVMNAAAAVERDDRDKSVALADLDVLFLLSLSLYCGTGRGPVD